MPLRRPSASASLLANNFSSSSSRAHKSTDSHHGFMNSQQHSLLSLGASATPQQKIVQVLVTRLKNKLPCISGVSLDQLEADNAIQQAVTALVDLSNDSLDMIAWALSELLERLAKQTDATGHLSIEVLQSQLFILKVLSLAMATRWNQNVRSSSRASNRPNASTPDSPLPPTSSRKARHTPSDYSYSPPPWHEPPPLDETCAKYILSVMVLFLRQTAAPEIPLMMPSRHCDVSFRDFESFDLLIATPVLEPQRRGPPIPSDISELPEPVLRNRPSSNSVKSGKASINSAIPIPANTLTYEKTHMTLVKSSLSVNNLIAKYAGRIVYHLSASNWKVVLHRLRSKIHFLASNSEDNPDMVDLQILAHCALDRHRLLQVLTELCSLLVNMKQEAHVAIAVPLRTALWNWIDVFPAEYNDVLLSRARLDGAPERVFDLLFSVVSVGAEKAIWPALAIINSLSSERLASEHHVLNRFQFGHPAGKPSSRKDIKFCEDIVRHANSGSRLDEIAFVCAMDMCRAAANIRPETEIPLRDIANDIAHEIKSALWMTSSRKPFWESYEEIDVEMYSEALVAVFRFCLEDDAIRLFLACLEPERSESVKTCAVRACLTLVCEAKRLAWQRSLDRLQAACSPRFRSIFKTAAMRRSEVDQYGNLKRISPKPKCRRVPSSNLSDKETLLLGLLSLWRSGPVFYFQDLQSSELSDWTTAAIKIWETPLHISIKISAACTFRLMAELTFKMSSSDPFFDRMVELMKRALSATLISIVTNLYHSRNDNELQRLWMAIAHQLIELFIRKSDVPHVKEIQFNSSRIPALALTEIVFLISLTSADLIVSQSAARGLRLLSQAERQPGAPAAPAASHEVRSKRHYIYEQLGDPNIMPVGRVVQQKRIRKLLKLLGHSTATYIAVWFECWARWQSLNEVVQDPSSEVEDGQNQRNGVIISTQEKIFQWQNLTLFLAALGGICIREDPDMVPLTSIIHQQYLPDRMRTQQNPMHSVQNFVTELTAMLLYDNVQVREIARDALGIELSPRLYPRLLKHVDEVISRIQLAGSSELTDNYALFLEQFIAVLKLIVENSQTPAEEINIDISSTMQSLAALIARFNSVTLSRIKIKYCTLCDSVCERKDILTLRKDTTARHSILDTVMDWIVPTSSDYDDEELIAIQNELNMACLRTAVKLLDNLQLRPLDSAAVDDHVHVVSRLFNRYSSTLLRGLDVCRLPPPTSDSASDVHSVHQSIRASQRDAELRELAITGLAHLVSANTESGFKQCLPLAYDDDLRKRTIFAHVFARVLEKGVKFEPEDRSAKLARQNRLCELLRGSDMVLPMAICEVCPASEADNIISVLLNLFDTRASLMTLIKLMIDREIAQTENEAELFRGNTMFTRFLSQFARIHGYNYLRSLIIPLVKSMCSMPPGHSYELDPNRAVGQDLEQNRRNVEFIASSFLEIVTSSIPTLPSMFREICNHIAKSVTEVWRDAKFAALGAFMFLRFISPAVVSPEIVDVELPREDGIVIRRGLMVITKIIQNLANNIFFGKEAYMVVLNKFLEDNIVNVTRYLSELNQFSVATAEEADEWLTTTSDDTDIIVLQRFLTKHHDRIGKAILSQSKPSEDKDTPPATKHAWNTLCTILVDLGKPLEAPVLTNTTSADHREYIDLMSRYVHKNTASVQDIFTETTVPRTHPAIFVFSLSKIDVEALDIELLMYHIFKILSQPTYDNRPFEIILDCTAFTSISEVPLQWIKLAAELIPADIRGRILATHILNPNALTQRYLRRIYNVCSGISIGGDARAYSSLAELIERVPESALEPLVIPLALEHESSQLFKDVTMRQVHQMRLPVELEVRSTHLRITSVKAQAISPSLACRSVEILPLKDVSDVYSVSIGHEPHEFIIRRTRQGVTVYFSAPQRDAIVKTIRAAKGQMRDAQSTTERVSRFSNVPATLLHVGLLCLDQNDDELRGAAYDLLGAVCSYLNYDKTPIIASKAGFVPGDPSAFSLQLSERLAEYFPELTLDFLSEVSSTMAVMDKRSFAQRINCLQYMSPWVKNLAYFPNPTSPLYERSGARLRDCIRVLADLTVTDHEISSTMQKCIWTEIGKLDSSIVNVILEELIRSATDGGIGTRRCDTMGRIIASFSSINVRGRIYSKLRKALSKITPRLSRSLLDNPNWNEISTLVSLALVAANATKQAGHSQLYVPEVVHLVILIAGVGPTIVRKSVYGIIMNLLQLLYQTRADDAMGAEMLRLVDIFTQLETLQLFGLSRLTPTSEYTNYDPPNDKSQIENQECLAELLVRFLEVTAGSKGLLNVWRARWMSLVTATAFQHSPAIQMRAFIALGCLATSEVDDDFLYQMLVALKAALSHASESDTISVVSMLRCIRKIVPALPDQSRYILPLFWVAVALLQASHMAFYVEATALLCITLETMESRGMFNNGPVSAILLEGRTILEEVACQLDQVLGISFDASFSFSLASIIFKGIRYSGLKESAEAALRSLLRITIHAYRRENGLDEAYKGPTLCPDALGYFLALLPVAACTTAYRQLLQDCNAEESWLTNGGDFHEDADVPHVSLAFLGVNDSTTALLVTSFVATILATAQGDDVETEILYNLLSDIATIFPETVTMIYEGLQERIKDTFANSSNPSIIRAVSNIFRVSLNDNPRFGMLRGSASTLSTVDEVPQGPGRIHLNALEELGMQGLASAFSFLPPNRGHAATKVIQWIPEIINLTIQ